MIWLGVAPCLAVIGLRIFPKLAESLPLVRATNITRALWFSDVFLMLAAGVALHQLWHNLARYHAAWRILGIAALTVCLVPRGRAFDEATRNFLINEDAVRFQPYQFLGLMKPYTRLAAFTDPVPLSADTKANAHHLLGSAGRSIILNRAFRDYLEKIGASARGFHGMTYYFKPGPPETHARFGIRYGLRYCESLEDDLNQKMLKSGWKKMGTQEYKLGLQRFFMVLFASPFDATPFYRVQGTEMAFLQNYRIGGNDLRVELPAGDAPYTVVATFLERPGWKAFINGAPVKIERGEDCFMRVAVPAAGGAGRVLWLKYEPYSDAFLVGCLVVSLLAAGGLGWKVQTSNLKPQVRA